MLQELRSIEPQPFGGFAIIKHPRRESGEFSRGASVAASGGMLLDDEWLNKLTGEILGAAIEVHRVLGPGLLESTYLTCLQFELADRGLRFTVQQPLPLIYKTHRLPGAYRIDLIVEDSVIVEVKAVDALAAVYGAQVLTYLRIADKPAGLLINFNVPRLMDGVKRLLRPGQWQGRR